MSAAALYLNLRALGVAMELKEEPERPGGYVIETRGRTRRGDADRVRRLIVANRAALIALLTSGSPEALAVRQEGDGYISKKGAGRRQHER